jgi:hypothetical protein
MHTPLPRHGWRLLVCAALFPFSLIRADDPIESDRKVATEWVKLQMETGQLASGWNTQRDLLDASIQALEQRRDVVRQQRDLLKAKAANEDRLSREATARGEAAMATVKQSDQRLADLTAKLKNLRPFLPPRLSSALELAYRSLDDTKLGTSERLAIAVSILNRSLQFDRAITFSEEVLPGHAEVVMEVVYWGLGQAYALDRSTGTALVGHPGERGWTWEAQPAAAAAITRLIDVHRETAEPQFVAVPARLAEIRATEAKSATP